MTSTGKRSLSHSPQVSPPKDRDLPIIFSSRQEVRATAEGEEGGKQAGRADGRRACRVSDYQAEV